MTGLCHCGIAVMVCVGWEGVWCLLSTVHTLSVLWCASQWCVCCFVALCCGLWNGGGCGVFVCLLCFLLFLFFFLVGGVRGSARAALRARTLSPNTIASPLLFALSCLVLFVLSAPRLSSCPAFPVIVEWRCVIHHVSVCLVGMTATGSRSLSFSFFW